MEQVIAFFRDNEIWIYSFLVLISIFYIRKFILAWKEIQQASFGLERESAQHRINKSASMLLLLLITLISEFILVVFISPSIPVSNLFPSPTIDILATNTAAPSTPIAGALLSELTTQATETPLSENPSEGCKPESVIFNYPKSGEQIKGTIDLQGTVDIQNFGFYKYEVSRPGDPVWQTISAGEDIVHNGHLGYWDTSTMIPGVYALQLVVLDNQGVPSPPCIIQVNITPP